MAKILVLFYQPIIDYDNKNGLICFYESFITELSKLGNEILCINYCNLKDYSDSECLKLTQEGRALLCDKIKCFNPNLIFAFNNQITEEIIKNTNCPICLMDADGVDLFVNKRFINLFRERYFMYSFYKGWEDEKYKNLGVKSNKIIFLNMATSIKNEKLEKVNNISFIGTKFGEISHELTKKLLTNSTTLYDLLKYYNEPYKQYKNITNKYMNLLNCDIVSTYPLLDTRIYVLQSLLDLGLKLYGIRWDVLSDDVLSLKLSFDKTPKYSLKNNQDIYNSSKINLSISHPQCGGYAFPWRIYDIMASGGLLISSYSKLLEEKTKGIVDIPMFKSPYEARDLCKFALTNPAYCEDIIAKSNEYIEKYGRWKNNFKIIENTIDIKLFNKKDMSIPYQIINIDVNNTDVDVEIDEKASIHKKFLHNFKIKQRIKIAFYGLFIILGQIPGIDLFIKKKVRAKLFNKLHKYWR